MPSSPLSEYGDLIDERYTLEEYIGEGTFAVTYRARDTVLERPVALKVLRLEYAADPEFSARFDREARLGASISHPNIVDLFDVGQHRDTSFIALEYVPGRTLKHVIVQSGPIDPAQAVEIAQQILRGLGAIHAAGIIHRDIKPQNVLVRADGTVQITDFGIAQRRADETPTRSSQIWGTAAYMSPEQARGERLSMASDLYAVGVVLYELLTGRLPFEQEDAVATMIAHVEQAPPPPRWRAPDRNIPPALEAVVMRVLAKDPAARYANASGMIHALDMSLATPGVLPTTGPSVMSVSPRPMRQRDKERRWLRPVLLAGLGLATVSGSVMWALTDVEVTVGPVPAVQAGEEATQAIVTPFAESPALDGGEHLNVETETMTGTRNVPTSVPVVGTAPEQPSTMVDVGTRTVNAVTRALGLVSRPDPTPTQTPASRQRPNPTVPAETPPEIMTPVTTDASRDGAAVGTTGAPTEPQGTSAGPVTGSGSASETDGDEDTTGGIGAVDPTDDDTPAGEGSSQDTDTGDSSGSGDWGGDTGSGETSGSGEWGCDRSSDGGWGGDTGNGGSSDGGHSSSGGDTSVGGDDTSEGDGGSGG